MSDQPRQVTIVSHKVGPTDLAPSIPVLSTARLFDVLDMVTARALAPLLELDCETSICAQVEIAHSMPVPLGTDITAKADYVGRQGEWFRFKVVVSDAGGKICQAMLSRAITCKENIVSTAALRQRKGVGHVTFSKNDVVVPQYAPDAGEKTQLPDSERLYNLRRDVRLPAGRTDAHILDHGSEQLIQLWLRKGAADLSATDGFGWTPLHVVARHRSPQIVGLLIDCGADINAVTTLRETALYVAWASGNIGAFNLLLHRGANPRQIISGSSGTSLHLAAQNGDASLVRVLIRAGLDINEGTFVESLTPLARAIDCGCSLSFIGFLLKEGADPDVTDDEGWGSLHFAIDRGRADLVGLLLDHGADPMRESIRNDTALRFAVRLGSRNIVQLLLGRGIDPSLGPGECSAEDWLRGQTVPRLHPPARALRP